ncbi:MAG: sugar phosphate isomerase/epimerase [Ruminococcaceae bacterium]|nr:sugar phosphate isomerase/epimerase [Oscillospiraceae bacterium]
MKTVMTTAVFGYDLPYEQNIRRLAAAGFDGIDLCIGNQSPLYGAEWEAYAKLLRDTASEVGAACTHSHLPDIHVLSPETFAAAFRGLAACGVGCTVIHPIWMQNEKVIHDEDEFFSLNLPLYKTLLGAAEKYGIKILCENLLWGPSLDPVVMSKLQDELNSPFFGWCFDVGHANVFDITAADLIGLNAPHSLHIHDNHGGKEGDRERRHASMYTDEHLLPYDGSINWMAFARALHDIGYQGDFVLEATTSTSVKGDDIDARMKELYDRALRIRAMIPVE